MYPRPGVPLVPEALGEVLADLELPLSLVQDLGLVPGSRVADLDGNVWRDLSWPLLEEVGQVVVRGLTAVSPGDLGDSGIFSDSPRLAELGLAPRVENALRRAQLVRDERLVPTTLQRLVRTRGIGPKGLLDILASLEGRRADDDGDGGFAPVSAETAEATHSRAVARAAQTLGRKRWARTVRPDDPRIERILPPVAVGATSIRELADWLGAQTYTPWEARTMVATLKRVTEDIDALRELDLAEELADVVSALSGKPTDPALIARFGFSGVAPATLEESSHTVGLTRERVRQLQKGFRAALARIDPPWMPTLDAAARIVEALIPVTVEEVQTALLEAGLVEREFHLESLATALEVFGRNVPFESSGGLVVSHDLSPLIPAIHAAARKSVEHWGATTVEELTARLMDDVPDVTQEAVDAVVRAMEDVQWLDERWFWVPGLRNRMLNQVEKIMSVAGSIELTDLRRGVGRHHRMQGFRPPREVLAELCVQSGHYQRDGNTIVGAHLPDWRDLLGEIERVLVETLFDHGPIMRREDLLEIVVDQRGLKPNSVGVYLTYSPLIEKYAPGIFGLRGARVSAAEISALMPPRQPRGRVFLDHGWTDDGRLWLGYRLSNAAVETGVLGTPAAVKGVVQGAYPLLHQDDPVGTLVVEDSMWGLSPFFRRWGVEPDDHLLIFFDVRARTASVMSGTEELLDGVRDQ